MALLWVFAVSGGLSLVAVLRLLSCSKACAVFLDQGVSPRLLPCKEDSQPPDCQGSLRVHSCGCTFHGFGQIDNGKDPDAGKDWGQEETRVTEDEMAGWHHRFKATSLSKLQDIVKDREAWLSAAHGVAELSNA